jgi:hypothetical protein
MLVPVFLIDSPQNASILFLRASHPNLLYILHSRHLVMPSDRALGRGFDTLADHVHQRHHWKRREDNPWTDVIF